MGGVGQWAGTQELAERGWEWEAGAAGEPARGEGPPHPRHFTQAA